ncbi:EAL domain-containing response regulator [Thalassotalea sp. G2M2-11]|uniref:EAL domain-containing response regulator n=1 Tax=Thalassotalea sp. G2M2-11 TaxID=2787627 RepID=UPI0019D1FCCF|nr:EAL domain-containing response regulator [Thalassotalea sp. G2M2-11]
MPDQNFSWLNVLLIDDSQSILDFVSSVLEQNYGIDNIYQATTATEAIQVMRRTKNFNLVFVDLNMPNMDGIQLLEQIHDLNFQGYIAIMSGIAIRIISSVESLAKQYKLNYIGTLIKPLHESDFEKIFNRIGKSRPKSIESQSLKTYEIVRAVKNNDLKVLYQPQVSLSDRKFLGVEALCRLNHPRLGMVAPNRFIDKAEESELIFHITIAVFKRALADWQKWKKLGLDITLSVNVSPMNMQQPEFADNILTLLAQSNMPANKLCLEVTEHILADDHLQELSNISRLSMHGIKIALDDFGKEHATIDRLRSLPLNYVKLDKSYFIEQSDTGHQVDLLKTSMALAERLHIATCAEGIETKEAMALAAELNCDIAQGYFISYPLPAPQILAWAHEWEKKT